MRMLRGVTLALCGLAFAGALFAAPADDIKALVEKGDAKAAYELGKKHPDQLGNPAFDFYFGVAAIDSGRAGEGVLALERYIVNFPDNVQARLELARGYFILGEDLRAREEFAEVLKAKPPAAVVANIERYLDAIRSREAAYRTTAGAFVEFGLGYDSNIDGSVKGASIILPNGQAGVGKIGSSFAQLTGGFNIVHPVGAGVALFGSLAADYKVHNIHQEFDQGNLGASGGLSYRVEQDLYRASLSFNTLDLDYRRFRDVTSLTGEWIRQLDEFQAVNAFAQYAILDYAGDNNFRDSRLTGVGAGYRRAFIGPWRPLLTLSASYAEEDNRRSSDFLARDIYGLRAAVSVTPAPKWATSAGATVLVSDYQGPSPTRRDKYYALDASVSYAFTRNLSLRGELLLSKNESNEAVFEYQREVVAVKVRYEFK